MPRTSAALSLADDLAMALDPVVFARAAGITPDPWQSDVLRSRHKRMLLNCSRQSGKSTTTALVALHRATYVPDSLVLLLSPSLRQSSELFRKVAGLYGASGGSVPSTSETLLRLELENGSRILSLPATENTIRGYSAVDLLIIDEASRVSNALYSSVRPMLATSNGQLVALSTPWGKRGWFSDSWHGTEPWVRIKVTADECPRIPASFLEEERRTLGHFWYDQEYLCQFLDAETAAFRTADIDRALTEGLEQWTV